MKRLSALLLLTLGACDRGEPFPEQTVDVGCGLCQYKMEGARACFWSAELDGEHVPLTGLALPKDHDAHGPGGMCRTERQAVIEGRLRDGQLIADRFELLPATDLGTEPDTHTH